MAGSDRQERDRGLLRRPCFAACCWGMMLVWPAILMAFDWFLFFSVTQLVSDSSPAKWIIDKQSSKKSGCAACWLGASRGVFFNGHRTQFSAKPHLLVSALPALSAFSSYPTSASVAYFHVQCTQHEDEWRHQQHTTSWLLRSYIKQRPSHLFCAFQRNASIENSRKACIISFIRSTKLVPHRTVW